MKEWFEYEYGYVNIDEHYIYFSNSGNWADLTNLDEFSSQSKLKNPKGISVIIILPILCIIVFFAILKNLTSGGISLTLIIGAPLFIFFIYKYMKSEIGHQYKIKKTKVSKIEFEENNCIIHFYDNDNSLGKTELINISKKGNEILKKLKTNI